MVLWALLAFIVPMTGMVWAAPVFPLKAAANGRYLTDTNNVPFRIHGDSPWDLLVTITSAEVDIYLNNRAAKGFNTLLVELVEHRVWAAGSPAPANKAGAKPFLSKLGGGAYGGAADLADLSTPNDAYFAYVDTIMAKVAAKNMVLLLTPLYVGFGAPTAQSSNNEGWSADMNANSSSNCYKYGQYVGDRYRNQKNIVWVDGGDATLLPPTAAPIKTCALQVMQGIKDGKGNGGSTVLHTGHWSREHLSTDDPSFVMQVNSVYSSPPTVASLCRTAYARTPVLPAYLLEAYYEGEHGMTPAQLRQQDYQAVLSCIGGYVFGNAPIWLLGPAWQAAMDLVGSLDFQRAGTLFDSLPWYNLVPSNLGTLAGKVLVPGADIATGGDVAAAASPAALVAYLPSTGTSARTITVNMTALGGLSRARWFNPTNGVYTNITGGNYTLPNTGTQNFTTPGNNGTGTNDWVLVLDVATLSTTLQGASSRRVHGGAGTFNLPLSLTPSSPTTDPRQGPAHTIVFTFDATVTAATATITEGTAVASAPTFAGPDVIVNLSGVTDHQYVTIALTNVTTAGGSGGSGSVRVGFLLGDVNQNRLVTLADLGSLNLQLAQPVSAANYLKDINASGSLTLADIGLANANLTKVLPAP